MWNIVTVRSNTVVNFARNVMLGSPEILPMVALQMIAKRANVTHMQHFVIKAMELVSTVYTTLKVYFLDEFIFV